MFQCNGFKQHAEQPKADNKRLLLRGQSSSANIRSLELSASTNDNLDSSSSSSKATRRRRLNLSSLSQSTTTTQTTFDERRHLLSEKPAPNNSRRGLLVQSKEQYNSISGSDDQQVNRTNDNTQVATSSSLERQWNNAKAKLSFERFYATNKNWASAHLPGWLALIVVSVALLSSVCRAAPLPVVSYEDGGGDDSVLISGDDDSIGIDAAPEVNDGNLFWVQRRRLNRDRSLEPPPWLRTRPIRHYVATTTSGDDEEEDEEAQVRRAQPARRSVGDDTVADAIYEALLSIIIEDALGGRSSVFDDLDAMQEPARPGELSSSAAAKLRAMDDSIEQQATVEESSVAGKQAPGKGKPDAVLSTIDGDEIAPTSGEEVTVVAASPQQQGLDNKERLASLMQQQQQQQQTQLGANAFDAIREQLAQAAGKQQVSDKQLDSGHDNERFVTAVETAADRLSSSNDNKALKQQQVSQAQLRQLQLDNGGEAMLGNGADIGDLMLRVNAADDNGSPTDAAKTLGNFSPEMGPSLVQVPAPVSDSFHVIEDIDRTDDDVQTGSIAMQPVAADSLSGGANGRQVFFETDDAGQMDSDGRDSEEGRLFSMPLMKRGSSSQDLMAEYVSPAGPVVDPFEKRALSPDAEYVGVVGRGNFRPTGADPARTGELDNRLRESTGLIATAVDLIKSGVLERGQLAQLATKLRHSIEDSLQLPRGSVVGLFPVRQSNKLIVHLDQSKLSAREKVSMSRDFDYSHGFVTVRWPRNSPQNPLPLFAALMDALQNEYDRTDEAGRYRYYQRSSDKLEAPSLESQVADESDATSGYKVAARRPQQQQVVPSFGRSAQTLPNYLLPVLATQQLKPYGFQGEEEPANDEDSELDWPPNSSSAARHVSLAMLINAYLNAMYAPQNPQTPMSPVQQNSLARALDSPGAQPLLLAVAAIASARSHQQQQRAAAQVKEATFGGWIHAHWIHLVGFALALLCATLLIKFSLRKLDRKLFSCDNKNSHGRRCNRVHRRPNANGRRSLWRSMFGRWTSETTLNNESTDEMDGSLSAGKSTDQPPSWMDACGAEKGLHNINNKGKRCGESCDSCASLDCAGDEAPMMSSTGMISGEKHTGGLGSAGGRFLSGFMRRVSIDSGLESTSTAAAVSGGQVSADGSQSRSLGATKMDSSDSTTASLKSSASTLRSFEFPMNLTQKFIGGISLWRQAPVEQQAEEDVTKEGESSRAEVEEAAEKKGVCCGDELDESSQRSFWSSRSYIKSLIDVLTKSARQSSEPTGKFENDDDFESPQTPLLGAESAAAAASGQTDVGPETQLPPPLTPNDASSTIVSSQMDISAAHLILAYMEQHLEDKERLRREWLELNSGSAQQSSSSTNRVSSAATDGSETAPETTSGSSCSSRRAARTALASQTAALHRLAKVGLSEENRSKNRTNLVVPFDRNRVKLGSSLDATATTNGSTTIANASPTVPKWSSMSMKSERGTLSSSGSTASSTSMPACGATSAAGSSAADYINASFIHDDDPRRPTHIIAQGPAEHTWTQFWQMVWEQKVSVLVMLTRLNENGRKMCHCYWPTNTSKTTTTLNPAAPEVAVAVSPTAATIDPPSSANNNGSSTRLAAQVQGSTGAPTSTTATATAVGRRGSVATSVYNGNATSGAATSTAASLAGSNGIGQSQTGSNGFENSAAANGRSSQAQQGPIVTNGDLSENILCFDVPIASGADASTKFEVHLVSEHVSSSDYLVRNMYLINRSTGETRTITQFHYLAWPDSSVPQNVRSLLEFRRKVHKSYRNLRSPILVHCSDGAGRSGTYTLVDIILERIKNGAKEIDPRATLEHLRTQRVGLCATQSQFEFVLMALAEEIQIILNALPQ